MQPRKRLPGPESGPYSYKTSIITDDVFDAAIEQTRSLDEVIARTGTGAVDYFGGWTNELESLCKETKFRKWAELKSLVEAGSELEGELMSILSKHADYAEKISALAEDLRYHAFKHYRE